MENMQLPIPESRLTIMVGEFGSGKTELAVNYSLQLIKMGIHSALVDIDLVKPLFRAREHCTLLEKTGVYVVAPDPKYSNADLPILPQAISRVLQDLQYHVVMDVGGGESAIVLGKLHKELEKIPYEALMVINTRRPFTSNPEDILAALRAIERVSRLKVTGLVSNTNLARETRPEHIREGMRIVADVAARAGIPVKWIIVPEWLRDDFKEEKESIFLLNPYTQYPWMD